MRCAGWLLLSMTAGGIASAGGVSGPERLDPFFAPTPGLFERYDRTESTLAEQAADSPNFVERVGLDFKRVFTTPENLAILAAGAASSLGARPFDDRIARSRFNGELSDGGRLDKTFEAGEIYGGTLVQGLGALTIWGVGRLSDKPGVQALGSDLVRVQIVNQALTQSLKYTVGRTRPDGSNQRSFPSGHSSSAFATATVLQHHYGLKAGIPAYVLAGYTAASRLSESKHFLSDVVFGAAIGILSGRSVSFGRGNKRFAVAPGPAPGGGISIQLTWVGEAAFGSGPH